jgi:hypothetical protein
MADALDALIAQLAPSAAGAAPAGDALDQLIANLKQPQAAAQPQQQVGVIQDVGKGVGAGLVKGTMGLIALPGTAVELGRMGVNKVGKIAAPNAPPIFPNQSPLPMYDDIKGSVERRTGMPLYEPKTKAGQYASTVAEFLPGMLFPAGGAATTFAGRMGQRALSNVIAPGIVSETAGQLTKGTSAEPYARVAGGIVGGMAPSMIGRAISPVRVDPQRTQQAATLAAEGVPVTAGQVSGSKPLRYAESVAVDTPFAGGRAGAVMDTQAERFTQATLRRAGIDAPRATPEVLDQAFQRIGRAFDEAGQFVNVPLYRTGTNGQPVPSALVRQVANIAGQYERTAQAAHPLPATIHRELATMAMAGRNMDGRQYLQWRSELGAAARGAQDSLARQTIYDVQRALDTMAETSLRSTGVPAIAGIADNLRTARREYRNLLVIEKAATSAGENAALGLISPSALRNATVQQGRRAYARGQGDFGDLARAGEAIMKPLPNSGTGPRVGVQLMGSAVGAGIGSMFGGPAGGMIGALAPMAGQAMIGRTTMSPLMQAYLQNQAGAALRDLPRGTRRAVLPGVVVQGND